MKYTASQGIVALTIAIIAIVGYWFAYHGIAVKSAAVAAVENAIASANDKVGRVTTAQAALAEISGDEAVVQGYFVSKDEIVSFNDGLQAIGRSLGSKVTILSVSATGTTTQPTFTLALSASGTFDQVMRTVGAIEYAPYDLSITNLGLNVNGKNSWNANMNLIVGSVNASIATSTP